MHQLLLGLVKDLLHWLLKYLRARYVKVQFGNRFTSVPPYRGLQRFSRPFDLMKSDSWQGKQIRSMSRTLAVNWTTMLDSSQDAGKSKVETASDEMVMGAVWALCEFFPLVSQQNHSALPLTARDNALKRFHKKKGAFEDQKMLKSAMAKVDELLARGSHRLQEQKIHIICAALQVQLYRAEKVTISKQRQFHTCLNGAQQAATVWSDADRQRVIEPLEREIRQVTPAKCKLFDKLFHHHERQLLQEVGTKAIGHRSIFSTKLAQLKTAAEEEAYCAVNMTAEKCVQFQVCLSDVGIEATTWSIADTDHIGN